MATYVNDLRLKEIATGDESGTWGTSTNTNLELIANAMGVGAEAIANASTHTITMADGTADEFRSTFLRLTGGGQACTVTLAPNTLSHTWIMRNETAAVLTLTQGSGANVAIAAGQTKIVATDGAGSGAVVYEMDDLELAGNLAVGGTLAVTGAFTNGSTLVSTGKITADAGIDIDNINIDGTTIALSSGDLTLDVAGDIVLDADGQDIRLKDAGTEWGRFTHTGHFGIQNPVSDADILFFGNDGGSTITALTLDMSAAGAATFNAGATFAGNVGIAASPTQARLDILQESDYSSHTGHGLSLLSNASNAYTALYIGSDDTVDAAYIQTAARNTSFTSKSLLLNPNGGKVGIGEASPAATLHLDSTGVTAIAFDSNASTQQYEMGTGYAGVGSANNFYLYNNTASSAVLVANSSGNVGIGNLSPNERLVVSDSDGGTIAAFTDSTSADLLIQCGSGVSTITPTTGILVLGTSSTERIRINADGDTFFGINSKSDVPSNGGVYIAGDNSVGSTNSYAQMFVVHSSSVNHGIIIKELGSSGQALQTLNSSGTIIGGISTTNTATSFNTSSDQRLKENIADADDAGSKIDAIQVRKHDWKADGSHQDYGMIAQELQTVAPEAVSGDADSDEMMGVDYSKLVPMLVKEIQSLRARVNALEAEG